MRVESQTTVPEIENIPDGGWFISHVGWREISSFGDAGWYATVKKKIVQPHTLGQYTFATEGGYGTSMREAVLQAMEHAHARD